MGLSALANLFPPKTQILGRGFFFYRIFPLRGCVRLKLVQNKVCEGNLSQETEQLSFAGQGL